MRMRLGSAFFSQRRFLHRAVDFAILCSLQPDNKQMRIREKRALNKMQKHCQKLACSISRLDKSRRLQNANKTPQNRRRINLKSADYMQNPAFRHRNSHATRQIEKVLRFLGYFVSKLFGRLFEDVDFDSLCFIWRKGRFTVFWSLGGV